MKLRKQIKNRIVAVAMLAVVFLFSVCVSCLSVSYASSRGKFHFTCTAWDLEGSPTVYNNKQLVVDYDTNTEASDDFYMFIDKKKFGGKGKSGTVYYIPIRDITDGGQGFKNLIFTGDPSLWGGYQQMSSSNVRNLSVSEKKYSYVLCYGQNRHDWKSNATKTFSFDFDDLWSKYGNNIPIVEHLLKVALGVDSDDTVVEVGNDSSESLLGSQDNPIKKDDFGYPQIYNSTYIHNDPNNLETLDKLYSGQDFQWKKKTTTGFDLTNNDYNYTYIECKVKANYQYNDKFSGKGSWHDFSSYGEMGNLGKVRAESLSHYYTFQEFQEALPKTSNELPDHKMRAIKSSAVYYFRVVCMKTSSTVVIPDEKDCKYYAGPWRSVTVTKINGKDGTSVVEDGEFDENGEWKKDDDSGDNGKDIDNGSAEGDDLSDASDKAHETINSNANKSTLDLDSAKAFINQVADVPKMIGDIFSFFPDWVKYTVELGFAFIFILIVYKLIRG